jgi:long-chain acyl-CoA synthetase
MTSSDRPWTAFYGPNVRSDIEAASYRTISDLIRSAADTYKSAPAFTTCMHNGMNGTLTFEQVDEMSDAFAVYLREVAGLAQGDRVAVANAEWPGLFQLPPSVSSRRAACW